MRLISSAWLKTSILASCFMNAYAKYRNLALSGASVFNYLQELSGLIVVRRLAEGVLCFDQKYKVYRAITIQFKPAGAELSAQAVSRKVARLLRRTK